MVPIQRNPPGVINSAFSPLYNRCAQGNHNKAGQPEPATPRKHLLSHMLFNLSPPVLLAAYQRLRAARSSSLQLPTLGMCLRRRTGYGHHDFRVPSFRSPAADPRRQTEALL